MCSGLSERTKSLVVSTDGATPSESGANWTFLIISFTVLLSRIQHETNLGQLDNWNNWNY